MDALERITIDPAIMGGRPCIRGTRVTVATIIGLLASGHVKEEILELYPYIRSEDDSKALERNISTGSDLRRRERGALCLFDVPLGYAAPYETGFSLTVPSVNPRSDGLAPSPSLTRAVSLPVEESVTVPIL